MNDIDKAVQILRSGGLVAFPTETVYGLGADATSSNAIRKIFAAKGRPSTNPLIVHVADATVARRYASVWPAAAQELAERFWPGPLTLVVPKAASIVPEATAGLQTVGLRAPDHPLTLDLLRRFDGPLAGPSANRSTRVSPTTAQHVREELGEAVDLVLDGGACQVGIESTVLDLVNSPPRILRPGAVTAEQIAAIIGPIGGFSGVSDPSKPATSPGQQAVHYAPQVAAYRFDRHELAAVMRCCRARGEASCAVAVIGAAPMELREVRLGPIVELPPSPEEYARRLYGVLRELDGPGIGAIFVEMPPDEPRWVAVRDRIRRATMPFEGETRPHEHDK